MNSVLIFVVFCSFISREIYALKCYSCISLTHIQTDGCHHGGARYMDHKYLVECPNDKPYCETLIRTRGSPIGIITTYIRGCTSTSLNICLYLAPLYTSCFRSCQTDGCNIEDDLSRLITKTGALPPTQNRTVAPSVPPRYRPNKPVSTPIPPRYRPNKPVSTPIRPRYRPKKPVFPHIRPQYRPETPRTTTTTSDAGNIYRNQFNIILNLSVCLLCAIYIIF